jgi:hypothetical protein
MQSLFGDCRPFLRRAGLDISVGVGDCADGGVGISGLNVEIFGEVGGHDVPRVCGEDFAGAFEAPGHEGRADFLAVHAEPKFRAGEEGERNAHDGEPAVMFVEAGLGELYFMDAIGIDDVFEVDDLIFGLFVDGNVALLNAAAEGFDDVAFFVDENSGVIPAREFFVGTPVTDFFAKANHAAGPASAVSEDEIAGARIDNLFAWREGSNRSSMKRGPRAFGKHECLPIGTKGIALHFQRKSRLSGRYLRSRLDVVPVCGLYVFLPKSPRVRKPYYRFHRV